MPKCAPKNSNPTKTVISRKRCNNLPIDDLMTQSSNLMKLAANRMSTEKPDESDPMVSAFAYKIKKIKDVRCRKMLELSIDKLINESL